MCNASYHISGFVTNGVVCDDDRGVMGQEEFWKGIDYVGEKGKHTWKEGTKIQKEEVMAGKGT